MTLGVWLIMATVGSLSAVDQVVVYPDRAQVSRSAKVTCGSRVALLFESIPPSAAKDSFRATITEGSIDGLRAELVTLPGDTSLTARALTAQSEQLDDEAQRLASEAARLEQQISTAEKLNAVTARMMSGESFREKPNTKSWQAALDASMTASLSANKALSENQLRLRENARERGEVRRRLEANAIGEAKQAYSVEVLASCTRASAVVTLAYLVAGASWTPLYEARIRGSEIDFSTWASISQSTGEEWADVDLVLSSAIPSQNATPPQLNRLMIAANEQRVGPKILVRRSESTVHSEARRDLVPAATTGLASRSQGLSVQMVVPEKSRVTSNGAAARVFVGRSKLTGRNELRVMPKMMPAAFRVVEAVNTLPWPLLPGQVDLFRSTGLMGRSTLESVPQGAPFTLTLGLEDSVRVKRVVVEEIKRVTGFFGGLKRISYAYTFELANYGDRDVTLALADHLPVSELDDVKVSIGETTTPGYRLAAAEGIASWSITIKPKGKQTIDFAYRVEVPASYETDGL